jgi:two-component system OmpR family sensor kinase
MLAGARSWLSGVSRPLQMLPIRVRLVALLVSLLLVALTLTSIATSALIRQQLMDNADRDLRAAAIPTASSVLNLRNPTEDGTPTNYAVKIMFTDGRPAEFRSLPSGERLLPDIPNLSPNDSRVGSVQSPIGQPFTVNSITGEMRWRVVAGRVLLTSTSGDFTSEVRATYAVAVPLRGVDTTLQRMLSFTILIGLAVIAACVLAGWYGGRRGIRRVT